MKHILFRGLPLFAVLVLALTAAFPASGAKEPFVAESDNYCTARGDADGDRRITTADARKVLRCSLWLEDLPDDVETLCDLDGRKGLAAEDARRVLRIAVGLDQRPAHKDKKTVTTQEATCYEQGISAHICAYCGEYYNFGVIPERPHTAVGWDIEREPTCSVPGEKRQYCIYCGVCIAREPIYADHIYGPMLFKSETPDCTRAQEVYHVCVNCGHVEEWIRKGSSAHSYVWVTVLEPTCTELGKQEEVCSVCGMKSGNVQNTFSLGGHIPSGWIEVISPTYKSEGLKRIVCNRCGAVLEEQVIPKLEY